MALFENLAEGFANAAGATGTAQSIENVKSDRRATAHEELEGNTHAILEDVKRLQERRAALPPGSPEIADIDKSLGEHQRAFTDLYHPTKNPGALQHLGRFLEKHVARKEPAPLPQSNAVTPERMAGLQASAAGTAQADPYLTPDELKKKARIAARLEPGAVADKPESENWNPETLRLSDGREITASFNKKDNRWTDLNGDAIPRELLATASVVPKSAPGGGSKFNQEKAVYEKKWGPMAGWSPERLSYFNQKMAYDSAHSGETTTTRIERDEYGRPIPVTVTNTHGPTKPPVDPDTLPANAGDAKKRAAQVAPPGAGGSNVKVGPALNFKMSTPAVASAQKDYTAAVGLDSLAKQVEQNPNDAVNQKRLAVALERVSAGRFTTQALDYIVSAGIANSIEGWVNKAGTGALPTDVMRQLIEGAHQNLKAKQDALSAAENLGGGGGNGDAYIYAKDPRGQVHRAKKGTALPQGWTITNAPTAQ